jgi:hypothetical protein
MSTSTTTQLSYRDRAVLRAIAQGRCTVSHEGGHPLTIDGFRLTDQFAKSRLTDAGLITVAGPTPSLTLSGRAVLVAA